MPSEHDDLNDPRRHELAEKVTNRLNQGSNEIDNEAIYSLMEGFI